MPRDRVTREKTGRLLRTLIAPRIPARKALPILAQPGLCENRKVTEVPRSGSWHSNGNVVKGNRHGPRASYSRAIARQRSGSSAAHSD